MPEAPYCGLFHPRLRLCADAEDPGHLLAGEAMVQPDPGSEDQYLRLPWRERRQATCQLSDEATQGFRRQPPTVAGARESFRAAAARTDVERVGAVRAACPLLGELIAAALPPNG